MICFDVTERIANCSVIQPISPAFHGILYLPCDRVQATNDELQEDLRVEVDAMSSFGWIWEDDGQISGAVQLVKTHCRFFYK